MNLNDLITKLQAIDTASIDEGGCGDPTPSMPPKPEPPEPSMNLSINAQGMDNIEDMIELMKKLGGVDEPDMPSMDKPMIAPLKMLPKSDEMYDEINGDDMEEAYANEPNEEDHDIDYMVNKLAGGMNRPKKTYDKRSFGDNPMQKVTDDDVVEQFRKELADKLREYKEK